MRIFFSAQIYLITSQTEMLVAYINLSKAPRQLMRFWGATPPPGLLRLKQLSWSPQ